VLKDEPSQADLDMTTDIKMQADRQWPYISKCAKPLQTKSGEQLR
jgi:hypothetical protein